MRGSIYGIVIECKNDYAFSEGVYLGGLSHKHR